MKSARRDRSSDEAPAGALALAARKLEAGQLREAERLIAKQLKRTPKDPAVLKLAGDCAKAAGQADRALVCYGDALAAAPDFVPALTASGLLFEEAGRPAQAGALYEKAIAADPAAGEALLYLARLRRTQGRTEEAYELYRRAVAQLPDYVPGLVNFGNLALQLGRLEEAEESYRRALAGEPRLALAHCNLALVLRARGCLEEAESAAQQAVALDDKNAEAWSALGSIRKLRGDTTAAIENCRKAVRLAPQHASYHFNLGEALRSAKEIAEAASHYEAALRFNPKLTAARNNLAVLREEQGNPQEAVRLWRAALRQDPENAGFKTSLSRALVSIGELGQAWDLAEAGFAAGLRKPDRKFAVPRWEGEPLAGRRLLIWREQGLGDEVRFASCYSDVLLLSGAQDGSCTIEADPRLVPVFQRAFPAAEVRTENKAEPNTAGDIDLQIPAGSLPRFYRRTYADFPVRRYLDPDSLLREKWAARLEADCPGTTVGICWRSGLSSRERAAHYSTLADWAAVFALPGISFVNLQYDDCEDELRSAEAQFGVPIHRWDDLDLKDDLEQVLALIDCLDLVVTAPTAVADLAGALQKETWRIYAGAPLPNMEGPYPWYGNRTLGRHWQQSWGEIFTYLASKLS